jgi:hypothetical protein
LQFRGVVVGNSQRIREREKTFFMDMCEAYLFAVCKRMAKNITNIGTVI